MKGVTYGTFRPNAQGEPFPSPAVVDRDFAAMANHGFNAVRVYTPPPTWLLDAALEADLRVMVGHAWSQHVTFLDDRSLRTRIRQRIKEEVRRSRGHPAILCHALGNEIPSSVVRWHGKRDTEAFLNELYQVGKSEDPDALFTYVNYPTTEYLDLPFLDLMSVNVYLEEGRDLEKYLARLHNLADGMPLLLAEVGMDSMRNGQTAQAAVVSSQISSALESGCAGAFVFGWTDEWHRGGLDITDWEFGLTTVDRRPKPALGAVETAFDVAPWGVRTAWPRISVVVCTFNGQRTIRETLDRLLELHYPDFEIIVVNDGSTDSTERILQRYVDGVRVISTENLGLSSARNTGLEAATGDIVAYLDDDAYPDPEWLHYLALAFEDESVSAVGGPNFPPSGDGLVADCVAAAPGNPTHVLLTDRDAEHIPGCNMAFRKTALASIGGFDTRFRIAGDDVDVCWRLQESGHRIGFHPAAVVWHHRRRTLGGFWKQQVNYGRAEAMLERKWPEKYTDAGRATWDGRIYGPGAGRPLLRPERVYHGIWGLAPFQSIYGPKGGHQTLVSLPEAYLAVVLLAGLTLLGLAWTPLLAAAPLLVGAVGLLMAQAHVNSGGPAARHLRSMGPGRLLVTLLHVLQPLARMKGRITGRLWPTPNPSLLWAGIVPRRQWTLWSEQWCDSAAWLSSVEEALGVQGESRRGRPFDRWDLSVWNGALGGIRLLMAVEEHGQGKQMVRFRIWPAVSRLGVLSALLLGTLALAASVSDELLVTIVLSGSAVAILLLILLSWYVARGRVRRALRTLGAEPT